MARSDGLDRVARAVIPIGPIIYAVSRGLQGARGGNAAKTDPRLANFLIRALLLVFVGPATGALVGAFHVPGAILLTLVIVASLPALFLHAILIPLGLPRAAYWFAIVSPPIAHSAEIRGGAALVGALALTRRRAIDGKQAAWLDAKLARALEVRSLSMAAAGVLAVARGKRETARLLFTAIDGLSTRSPRLARRVARTWLVAEAAQRGEWREVAALGGRARPYLRWSYGMATIARRLTSDPRSPANATLWLMWLLAPHRRATLPLLRRALAVPRRKQESSAPSAPVEVFAPSDPLEAALHAHAACLRDPSELTLFAAGFAWDAVRASAAVRAVFARRALSLEASTTPDAALGALLATAEADLAPLLRPDRVSASLLAKSGTLDSASGHTRRRAMDEIEARATAMAQRTARKTALHVSGEWMEWGALRRACDRVARDAPDAVRRTVFATVYGPACNYAVWLFNVRGEKLLANGIFRWLAAEARVASDPAALKVLEKNVKVGEGI